MRLMLLLGPLLTLMLVTPASWCHADMDWQTTKNLNLPDKPLEMKFSRDGQWLYLLMDKGVLMIYDSKGPYRGMLEVGRQFDSIEPGPHENEIYLMNRRGKQIQVIEVSHVWQIDTSQSPFKGPSNAPVEIVEYTDFQCPYCARLVKIFKELMILYPGKLKIVYKSFPLGNHPFAYRAATAAMAAHQKGQFWGFHDRLFENYKDLNEAKLDVLRKQFGFDTPQFTALMNRPDIRAQVAKDRNEGLRNGVQGTPTIFINGKRLKDKRLPGFRAAIEKELKRQP